MRMAVLDYYVPTLLHKDPAQITIALQEIGIDVTFIPRNDVDISTAAQAPFPLITSGKPESPNFWRGMSLDAVIVISRLSDDAYPILVAVKDAGIRLIIKGDTDGTLGYPLIPNYLRSLNWRKNPVSTLFRNIKWRFPTRRFVEKKLLQMQMADAVIVESPGAKNNIARVLAFWQCASLTERIFFVPNPIALDVSRLQVRSARENMVIAVGRWEDQGPKNTDVMVKALVQFLHAQPSFRATIVGSGYKLVSQIAEKRGDSINTQIHVMQEMKHERLMLLMQEAKILLMPSRIESFGLAAAEALCAGCSIAVTPIESLEYLAADGFSGTVSRGFDHTSVTDALLREANRWESGERDPDEISHFWRARLDRRRIASAIVGIADAVWNGTSNVH